MRGGRLDKALGLYFGEYEFEPRPRQLLCRDLLSLSVLKKEER